MSVAPLSFPAAVEPASHLSPAVQDEPAAMRASSPELVQAEDWSQPPPFTASKTPIFLIHDGGGTTFAYHCLDPLYRYIYGIANPNFYSGTRFVGGIPEMGRLYAKRIRSTVSQPHFPAKRNADGSVDIFLGGWSLGGLLSLEVARFLANDCLVRVVGILMVDSVCPGRPDDYRGPIAPPDMSEEGKTKNQILAQRCMAEARRMLGDWEVPTWQGWYTSQRPKMVLLRATNCVPTHAPGISALDINRDDAILGWGRHDDAMFDHVVDVEGHHFDLFTMDRIGSTTAAMQRGLERLEAAVYPWMRRGGGRNMFNLS